MKIAPTDNVPPTDIVSPALNFQPRKPMKYRPRPAPVPAAVVSATLSPDGTLVTLAFDRPVLLAGGPHSFDDGLQLGGSPPVAVAQAGPAALAFTPDKALEPGAAWSITAQPAWVATPLALPQDGTV